MLIAREGKSIDGGAGDLHSGPGPRPRIADYCKHQIVYHISLSYFLCSPEVSVSGCED